MRSIAIGRDRRRLGSKTLLRSVVCVGLVVSELEAGSSAHAQTTTSRPSPSMDAPDPPAPPTASSEMLSLPLEGEERSTPEEWRLLYEEAHAKVVAGDFAAAALQLAALESSAVNRVDRAIAHAERALAEEWSARGARLSRGGIGADAPSAPPSAPPASDHRSTDEFVTLVVNGGVYGLGSAIWIDTLTRPETVASGVIPGVVLIGAGLGSMAALDSGRGFRYGVPQAIVSGLWMGLEQGLVWSAWHSSRVDVNDAAPSTYSSIIWGLSTLGAGAGGLLGSVLGTTPGRAAWVGSTSLWTGTIAGLTTGALVSDASTEEFLPDGSFAVRSNQTATTALAVAGVGLTVGTALGFGTASAVSPSIGRVRLIDVSGLLTGVAAAGVYYAAANRQSNGHALAGVTAIGVTGGLLIGWAATSSMPPDRPRRREEAREEPRSPEHTSGVAGIVARMRPSIMPATGGAMIGAFGSID